MVAILLLVSLVVGSCASIDVPGIAEGRGQDLTLAGSTFGLMTLDPALVRDVDSAFLARQVFRGLVRLDENLQPVPDLAREISVSEDGLEYRFELHTPATFHNDDPLDADAVVRSFNRAADPALMSGDGSTLPAATYFADIEGIDARLSGEADVISGVRADGDSTVVITLKRPAVNFLSKLTGVPAAIVDVASAVEPDWWTSANGSGPFRVESYQAGRRLRLVAYDDFVHGRPRLDSVTILLGSEAVQPMNLYETGRIDVTGVPTWALDRVLAPNDPLHAELVESDQLSTTFIALNPNEPPYDDPRFRSLIAHTLDVETLVSVGMDGKVERATGLIPPGTGGSEWPAQAPEHDTERAAGLLAEIDPIETPPTFYEPGGGIGVVLKAVLARDLGIELEVIDQPWPEFAARLTARDLPAFVLTWVADFPDPENTLADLLRSSSADNYVGYSSAEFDRLVDQAAVETDPEKRRERYLAAQQIAIDDAVVIPLYHQKSYTLVQPWVRDLVVTEIGILSLEDVWIEDE